MKINTGDTIVLAADARAVGIVESRKGDYLTVRFPDSDNKRERLHRHSVRAIAEAICEARSQGRKFRQDLSLTGGSTLAELVAEFGYATQRLRSESLMRVIRQLERAGLEVHPETERWSRDDKFKLVLGPDAPPENLDGDVAEESLPTPDLIEINLPEPFWPTALGLDPNQELYFLRSLTASQPIICLLHFPVNAGVSDWLQATWEGLVSWAFHGAQRFSRISRDPLSSPEVLIGQPAMLQTYFEASVLNPEAPRLLDRPNSLNLITLKKESESPVNLLRLKAAWPGPVFEFKPQLSPSATGQRTQDLRALLECLFLVAGAAVPGDDDFSPLNTFLWCKEAASQALARAGGYVGEMLAGGELRKFKGSNESATALALKSHLARWIKSTSPGAALRFEEEQVEHIDELGAVQETSRIDLLVEGRGRFEVETMAGSGPIESFYHQKVFRRASKGRMPLWLVVPNEAVLWAGPYLADLAHHLGPNGNVILPGHGENYIKLQGKPLDVEGTGIPWDDLREERRIDGSQNDEEGLAIRLRDVAGYEDVRDRINDLIIWPEKHRRAMRRPSRASGILFFGPPGCGKSRLARAIAGELEQEVRLLSPSDLRGAYVGWGQILIREHFNWVAEHERRMLVIDEIDAVARSRRGAGDMHSDEKANVNEMLVQLDRISRLGRLVVGTTNFVDSLDDALVRSGRFGRFIPVAPPDIDEAIDILSYYLQALISHGDSAHLPAVHVPHAAELRATLEPVFADNASGRRFLCGADLEEAVNRTYQSCLRQALGDKWPEDYAGVEVHLTTEALGRSLNDVPRSVTEEAVEHFINDVNRFCGAHTAARFSERLCPES